MERERAEAQRLREELESYKKTEEERLRVEYGRVERELERQRAIALGMVESAKSAGDYIMAELEEVKRHKDAADLGERMSAAKQNIRRQASSGRQQDKPGLRKGRGRGLCSAAQASRGR